MSAPDLAILLSAETLRLIDELGPIASTADAATALLRLRRSGIDPAVAATVLTQARLRARAVAKFGDLATGMLFTEDGLQQATRLGVAARHAARFRSAGIEAIADLGCGIGADSLAFSGLGISVRALERDPITAAIAAYNLAAFPDTSVEVGDAEQAALDGVGGAWLDPARRRLPGASSRPARAGAGSGSGKGSDRRTTAGSELAARPRDEAPHRLRADQWSPALDFAFGLAERLPTGVKLGPGIDRELIPEGWEAQWVSDGGEVVELAVWSGPLARPGVARAALVIGPSGAHELTAASDSVDAPVGELGEYLVEPDGAIIRARLIGDLARALSSEARMLHPTIAYVTLDEAPRTAFGQAFRVLDVLPLDAKAVRRALAERGMGSVEIKKRGVDLEPETFRRQLKLSGDSARAATVILTRVGERRRAILVERL